MLRHGRVIPPIFLLVSAFLINMILSRLVALEREQIGLLKAIGYGGGAIAWHYLKLVILIAVVGIAIGFAAGTWLGARRHEALWQFYISLSLLYRGPDLCFAAAALSLARGASSVLLGRSTGCRKARAGRCDAGAGTSELPARAPARLRLIEFCPSRP